MEFEAELIRRGRALSAPLPDYAAAAYERLLAEVEATEGRQLDEPEEARLRKLAAEAMAGVVGAEERAGTDTSLLVSISEVAAWVRELQAALEADAR